MWAEEWKGKKAWQKFHDQVSLNVAEVIVSSAAGMHTAAYLFFLRALFSPPSSGHHLSLSTCPPEPSAFSRPHSPVTQGSGPQFPFKKACFRSGAQGPPGNLGQQRGRSSWEGSFRSGIHLSTDVLELGEMIQQAEDGLVQI